MHAPGELSGHALPTIVPVLPAHVAPRLLYGTRGAESAQIPQLNALVLAVSDDVPAVSSGVDVRQAIHVAGKNTYRSWTVLSEGAAIPYLAKSCVTNAATTALSHFADSVVSPTGHNVRVLINEGHGVNIILVSVDLERLDSRLAVIEVDKAIIGAT